MRKDVKRKPIWDIPIVSKAGRTVATKGGNNGLQIDKWRQGKRTDCSC